MTDLVIPSTSSSSGIEKVACLGGLANGRRELALARLGEVVIVKVEEVRVETEESAWDLLLRPESPPGISC